MLSDRQKLILKAVIEEYVSKAEPVGSAALINKPYLNFSSATIRAEMATLEVLGYLEKTHTSSGRIPSEKGYRYYVECLVTRDASVTNNFPLIDKIFKDRELSRDDAIKEALNFLSDLTHYTTVAFGRGVENSLIKKLDFIPLTDNEAVVLIVTDSGHVQNQRIVVPDGMNIDDLRKVVATLDDVLKNKPLYKVEELLYQEFSRIQIKEFMDFQEQFMNSFLNAFSKFANDDFYLSGISNVFEFPEFRDVDRLSNLLSSMEKQSLTKIIPDKHSGLRVKIGSENEIRTMDNCTIISVPYQISDDEMGTIAVIGPTRMEYKKVIPLVEYIAKNMTDLYKK